VDINPDRRTQEATDLVEKGSAKWNSILAQEKLPAAFTMDVNAGKSFRVNKYIKNLKRTTTAYLNMGVVNVLNKTDIKVAGFEQLRYDYSQRNANRFPNKYDYAFGANYYVSLSLRF
jgi:outer membrane receptor protein involved in Fe transport